MGMRKSILKKLLLGVAMCGLAGSVLAIDFVDTGDGLWTTVANWGGTLPTTNDWAKVSNADGSLQTVTVGSGVNAVAGKLHLGYTGGGTINIIDGGTVSTFDEGLQDGDLLLGKNGGVGTMNLTNGTVNVGKDLEVANGFDGVLNMLAGQITVDDDFEIGNNGTGTVNMEGGQITATGLQEGDSNLRIYANGALNIHGGTVSITGGLNLASGAVIDLWQSGALFIGDITSNELATVIDDGKILGNRLTNNLDVTYGVGVIGTNAVTNATISAIDSIPNLAGLTPAEATEVLAEFGYLLGVVTEGSAPGGITGQVISSDPAAGTPPVAPGTEIDVVIQQAGQVPDVLGLVYADATNDIISAGYTVTTGTVTYVFGAEPGLVTGQSPAPLTAAAPGTAVIIDYNELLAAESVITAISPGDWMTSNIWDLVVVPFKDVQNYEVRIAAGTGDVSAVTVTNFVAMRRLHIGHGISGQVDVLDGGELITGLYNNYAAVGWDGNAVLNVYTNGTFESAGAIRVGWNGSSGTINIDGGTVVAASWISLGKSNVSTNEFGDPLESYVNIKNGGSLLVDRFRDELDGITYQEGVITLEQGSLTTTGTEAVWITNGLASGFIVIADGYIASHEVVDGDYKLTSRLPGYAGWALSLGIGGENEDFDLDLQDNLYEYAMNGDPKDPLVLGEDPVLVDLGGSIAYTHLQRNDDSNLVYSVETTADLVSPSWAPGYAVPIGTNVTGDAYDVVTNTVPTTADEIFVRLEVTNP